MKKTLLAVTTICLLALSVSAQAMMGSGGTGMTGGTGSTTGGTGTLPVGTMGTYMQMPMSQQMFTYGATTAPLTSSVVTTAMPIGVGSVAMGGNTLDIQVDTSQFAGPVDMYFAIFAPSVDPFNIYTLHPDGSLQPASSGIEPWISGVTSVNQTMFGNIPTSALAKGTYTLGLMATPAGANMSTYYLWMTNFTIQ
jgi:hypothetical protein